MFSFNGLISPQHSLCVELLKLLSPHLIEPGAGDGAHQRPISVLLHSLHEQVGHPERVEEVTCSLLLLARVLATVEEVEDVGVPGLQVDGERARPLSRVDTYID